MTEVAIQALTPAELEEVVRARYPALAPLASALLGAFTELLCALQTPPPPTATGQPGRLECGGHKG